MPTPLDEIRRRLDNDSSHSDVGDLVNRYLENLLGWTLTRETDTGSGGSIDTVPVTEMGDREVEVPAFVIEYKSGESNSVTDLEEKQGGRQGETAIEQLERYVTTKKICNYGFLVDASRFVVYQRFGDGLESDPEYVFEFEDATDDDFKQLKSLIPLKEGLPPTLQINDVDKFVGVLQDSISWLTNPLDKLYDIVEPEEHDLLLQIIPSGISRNEFVQKTAASMVSKVLLLRALEDQNSQFGIVLNPDVIKSFARSEYGYLLAYSSAYDLGGMKFPQVFKADIDVFDWWEPRQLTSATRREASEAHKELNRRLMNILEQLYRYQIEIERDLMGLTYQRLRKKGETSVLGAYYTPPELTNATVDAVEVLIDDLDLTDYTLHDLYENPDFDMIDASLGSGTFAISYANKAINYTDRRGSDIANQIIEKIHGIDVDPLAVLMARVQVYGTLSEHLDQPPAPNVYWTNTLEHVRGDSNQSLARWADDFSQISPPIDEVEHDLEQAQTDIEEGSFDLVIGNPPWGRKSEIIRHLKEQGVSAEDAEERVLDLVPSDWEDLFSDRNDNLLTPFFHANDQLLKEGGIMALILDARFQASEWGSHVLDLMEDYQEVRILDISLHADFPESASYPAIVLGVK
jgi:methylase of polypeptide subunit release factors